MNLAPTRPSPFRTATAILFTLDVLVQVDLAVYATPRGRRCETGHMPLLSQSRTGVSKMNL